MQSIIIDRLKQQADFNWQLLHVDEWYYILPGFTGLRQLSPMPDTAQFYFWSARSAWPFAR